MSPRTATWIRRAGLAGLLGYAVQAAVGATGCDLGAVASAFELWVYGVLFLLAAVLCLASPAVRSQDRVAWVAFGFALATYAGAELAYSAFEPETQPSPVDLLWLAFYPACYVGVALLLRRRVSTLRLGLWVDGLIGALAVGALGTALVGPAVNAQGAVAVDLAYLVGDAVLLSLVVGLLALTGWRPGRTWGLIGTALVLAGVADALSVYEGLTGVAWGGTLLATLAPASALTLAWAAWQPAEPVRRTVLEGWRMLALPAAFAFTALALLAMHAVAGLVPVAVALAIATLAVVILRFGLTYAENVTLLRTSRHEAMTDVLTGLGNRRALMDDLQRATGTGTPHVLLAFDLDGFKAYNDAFGHPAGDTLLARLGGRLHVAVEPWGRAFRLGGDEFCALVAGGAEVVVAVREAATGALTEAGEDFDVSTSCGTVLLPDEAAGVIAALGLADHRLYAEKTSRRRAASGREAGDALLQTLRERQPELGAHVDDVAGLARETALVLGRPAPEVDEIVRAAELHDVGKVAVPDAILHKPGPLSEEEWQFMRQHTLMGDRILRAAPALDPVANLVRASHERWDGCGYPDGLAGEEIPLGARIIAVCDAYHAMTSQRAYRSAREQGEAIAELRSCAGTQFDPRVVHAVCAVLAAVVPRELEVAVPAYP